MRNFRTYLIVNNKQFEIIKTLNFSHTDFQIEFLPEPTQCYWESLDGKSEVIYTGGKSQIKNSKKERQLKELIIKCQSEDIAENALSLIKGGILLALPTPNTSLLNLYVSEYKKSETKFYQNRLESFHKLDNIAFGCQILEKIITNKEYSYALEKYKISLDLFSLNPFSIDPMYGQMLDHYDLKKQTHTRSAFAIIAAFSVIEELSLEIRSSSKKPRFSNNEKGEWNPIILSDITNRLEKIGIKNEDTFNWVFRGEKTKVENDLKPYFGFDSEWVKYGETIRDKTLTFPEAIHNASYLRNFIASHKFKELTEYISPYDVYNIQALSRKLILESLGMWQTMLNRNKNSR
jgi:hypothetical protein